MPIPTTVADLSTTIASNSPSGSDNVFPDLDNYLRALSGILASVATNSATNGYTTPYVALSGATMTGSLTATKFSPSGTSATGNGMYLPATNTLGWSTAGAEVMRLDAVGNLGLGVTPSAWNSTSKAIQVSTFVSVSQQASGAANFGFNFYEDAANIFKYSTTDEACRFSALTTGGFGWFTAPSGTAGNAITFTQAMTLSSSATRGTLDVNGASDSIYTLSTAGSRRAYLHYNGTEVVLANETNNPMLFLTNATERARITSGGDFGVGVTPSSYGAGYITIAANGTTSGVFDVLSNSVSQLRIFGNGSETRFQGVTNVPMTFYTNNTERVRITSGGYFKASNTGSYTGGSANPLHEFSQDNTGYAALYVYHTASATNNAGINITYNNRAPNDTANNFLSCSDSVALRATFRSNGGLANYSGNDVNLSDRREKTNFAPAKSYLDTICAIPVQTFNYIDQSEDDPGLTLGVVAQDVQAVAPELVSESNWGTEDNPKMRLSIYQTDMQYALMKCIQELKAQNDELRARVAALEA